MKTPKEQINERRKKMKRCAGNILVLICTVAGVLLSEPWRVWRSGGDAVGKHKRLVKRCIMGFFAGAGARMVAG